jgi:hypothetical protein
MLHFRSTEEKRLTDAILYLITMDTSLVISEGVDSGP